MRTHSVCLTLRSIPKARGTITIEQMSKSKNFNYAAKIWKIRVISIRSTIICTSLWRQTYYKLWMLCFWTTIKLLVHLDVSFHWWVHHIGIVDRQSRADLNSTKTLFQRVIEIGSPKFGYRARLESWRSVECLRNKCFWNIMKWFCSVERFIILSSLIMSLIQKEKVWKAHLYAKKGLNT